MTAATKIVNCDCCCPCTITVGAPTTPTGGSASSASDDFLVSPDDCNGIDSLSGTAGGTLTFPLDGSGWTGVVSIAAPQTVVIGGVTKYFAYWLIDVDCCIQNFADFRNDGATPPGVYCHYDEVISLRLCDAAGANAAGGCSCTITPIYTASAGSGWGCSCCSCFVSGVEGSSCTCAIDGNDPASPCAGNTASCTAGGGAFGPLAAVVTIEILTGNWPNLLELIDRVQAIGVSMEYIGGRTECGDPGNSAVCRWEGETTVSGGWASGYCGGTSEVCFFGDITVFAYAGNAAGGGSPGVGGGATAATEVTPSCPAGIGTGVAEAMGVSVDDSIDATQYGTFAAACAAYRRKFAGTHSAQGSNTYDACPSGGSTATVYVTVAP